MGSHGATMAWKKSPLLCHYGQEPKQRRQQKDQKGHSCFRRWRAATALCEHTPRLWQWFACPSRCYVPSFPHHQSPGKSKEVMNNNLPFDISILHVGQNCITTSPQLELRIFSCSISSLSPEIPSWNNLQKVNTIIWPDKLSPLPRLPVLPLIKWDLRLATHAFFRPLLNSLLFNRDSELHFKKTPKYTYHFCCSFHFILSSTAEI